MLSEKYMAGFIDADGWLGIRSRIDSKPDLAFEISQHNKYAEAVITPFKEEFGGCMRTKLDNYQVLGVRGKKARKLYERLAKYMVIKHDIANEYLKFVDSSGIIKTTEEMAHCRKFAKEIRLDGRTSPLPNFPSRKWLAGYFDGDGCFSMKVSGKKDYGYVYASILSAKHYSSGIDLIQKAFGGTIVSNKHGNLIWTLQLTDPSKCKEFVGYFADDLVEKKAQAYFLLGCASGGNFRDGQTIRKHLMALNAQQHRLNSPEWHASELVKTVRFDIPKVKSGRPFK